MRIKYHIILITNISRPIKRVSFPEPYFLEKIQPINETSSGFNEKNLVLLSNFYFFYHLISLISPWASGSDSTVINKYNIG